LDSEAPVPWVSCAHTVEREKETILLITGNF
jgi:hypothetical protein